MVEAQLLLSNVNEVNTKAGSISLTGYLRTWWLEPRLAYASIAEGGCFDYVTLKESDAHLLWIPDIYIDNIIGEPGRLMETMTRIYPSGEVWRSVHVTMTVKAAFDLGRVPYDIHLGRVRLASYSLDISLLRLFPRGGTPDEGVSGAGVVAWDMANPIWHFSESRGDGQTWQTPGQVRLLNDWDYLDLHWTMERKASFFIRKVMCPVALFSLISYLQFFVDASSVPARATLAIIPVLIMRTLSNSIHSTLPEASDSMWIDDFVLVAIFINVGAALHFGIVQSCRLREKRRAGNLEGLVKAKATALKLIGLARQEQIPLMTLLERFKPEEYEFSEQELSHHHNQAELEVSATQRHFAHTSTVTNLDAVIDGVHGAISGRVSTFASSASRKSSELEAQGTFRKRSKAAEESDVFEADILFICYAARIYQAYDSKSSGLLPIQNLRLALKGFNIYLTMEDIIASIPPAMRDMGYPTPLDERMISIRFSQFLMIVMQMDRYCINTERNLRWYLRRGLRGVWIFYASRPASERWDIAARYFFPVILIVQVAAFWMLLNTY